MPAKDAYISPYFRKNRAYAERFSDRWMVLSAKYGFIDPDEMITDYNVTFKKRKSGPISNSRLREQAREMGLDRYEEIIVLGGKEYLEAIEAAFEGTGCRIISPFRGMSIGVRMKAIDRALD